MLYITQIDSTKVKEKVEAPPESSLFGLALAVVVLQLPKGFGI